MMQPRKNFFLMLSCFCKSIYDGTGCTDRVWTPVWPMKLIKRDSEVGVKQWSLSAEEWREWHLCAHRFLLLCCLSCAARLVYSLRVTAAETQHQLMQNRMSAFHHLAPLMSEVSPSCRQTNEHPKVCLSPPLSLSSPVIKKKVIQIPSFDEKGLVLEKHNTKLSGNDKLLELISSSASGRYSHSNCGERASTLPRAKSKTHSIHYPFAKPNICISPAPKPDSHPTIFSLKPKPSDSLRLPTSQLSDFHPLLDLEPEPKLRVSPTLTVPTPRLSPSPISVSQGSSSDGQGGRQPSPVAKDRRARSIPISNSRTEPSTEGKHEVLDQEALMDFTHTGQRRIRPVTSRENRHQTESDRLPAASKAEINETDINAKPKPNPKIKQQQEGQSGEAAKCAVIAHRDSQSGSDGPPAHPSLQKKPRDYTKKSIYTQTSDYTCSSQPYEQVSSGKRAVTPLSGPISADAKTVRRQFVSHNQTRLDTSRPLGSHHRKLMEKNDLQTFLGNTSDFFHSAAPQSLKPAQKSRFSLQTQSRCAQMDVKSAESHPDCLSKDSCCQSKEIDQKTEASPCAHRLNRLKTCLVAPQALEASSLPSADCRTSHSRPLSKPDLRSHSHSFSRESPGQHKSHKEVDVSNTGLNQTGILEAPRCYQARAKLLEHSWTPNVAHNPFMTNSSGSSPGGVCDPPQHKIYQRPGGRTATASPQTQKHTRAFIMEESDDPYYVTMCSPGSVYVGWTCPTRACPCPTCQEETSEQTQDNPVWVEKASVFHQKN